MSEHLVISARHLVDALAERKEARDWARRLYRENAELRKEKWTSVEDGLPEEGAEVLGLLHRDIPVIVRYKRIKGCDWVAAWDHTELDSVTHWQPLPSPPEQK